MSSVIKERPILFSGPMVRAILDGRKTQTRRVIKPQPLACETEFWCVPEGWFGVDPGTEDRMATRGAYFQCPYGITGDRLWVQEAWSTVFESVEDGGIGGDVPLYKATFAQDRDGEDPDEVPWLHGRRMPRWASRISLEITAVRIERLNDISHEDAIAEGCPGFFSPPGVGIDGEIYGPDGQSPVDEFRDLWSALHGPGSWSANPFVWVVEFRKVAQ